MQKFIEADYYFACSKESGEWLFGNKIKENKNFYILKNAIDIYKYDRNEYEREKIRKELGIDKKLVIGTVGRFTEQKNSYFILEVFKALLNLNKNAELIWIGEGELFNEIRLRARKQYIENNILFTGSVSNVEKYMQAMDVFLFPSKWEGLPLTLVEAQAAYIPCLISDTINTEVVFSPEVIRYSLNSMAKEWAEQILCCKYQYVTKDSIVKEITSKGYNVNTTALWLQKFYMEVK